ncbi:hypothetical protein SteCoe_17606 [Stentor coeruleus]|uniref:Uncharacterized protein n=1 Tax=Stentor coeruleus TaxID=5963 RepID=A0A1R2BYG7_9CILI|nr:hypothetical protein SteCoe_17606 [Stentor coeruleus]
MYSKFGKVIAERFQILNHRDEILSGRVKKIRPPSAFARNEPKSTSFDITEEYTVDESPQEPEVSEVKEKILKNTVSFTSQSREEFYKSTDKKIYSPPIGHYNCKYSLVFKAVNAPKFKMRPPTKSRRKKLRSKSAMGISLEKPKQRPKSPLTPFDKQMPRPPITSLTKDVNEKRFACFNNMPAIYTKYKRVSTPNMSKSTERGPLFQGVEQSPEHRPRIDWAFKKKF